MLTIAGVIIAALILALLLANFVLAAGKNPPQTAPKSSIMHFASETSDGNYKNVYKAFEKLGLNDRAGYRSDGGEELEIAAYAPLTDTTPETQDMASAKSQEDSAFAAPPEFSDTNIQVEGVQEADVIKTDGEYIYTINSEALSIIKAGDGHPEVVGNIPQINDVGQVYFQMYITRDRLIAVKQGYNNVAVSDAAIMEKTSSEGRIAYPGDAAMTDTSIDIFDIKDRSQPKKINTLSQSGAYADSRMIGDKLYLVSNYSEFDYEAIDEENPKTFVPLFAEGEDQKKAEPADISFAKEQDWMNYTVISGIDTSGDGRFVSEKSIFGSSYELYSSQSNMYLTCLEGKNEVEESENYRIYTSHDSTLVTRISLDDGNVAVMASAGVPGTVLNQFSIDEYNGVLRMVTTEHVYSYMEAKNNRPVNQEAPFFGVSTDSGFSETNALYTLDQDFNLLGQVTDLAPGEQVYSCRFMGDVAYFVTFRQVDPLFSVDVSDPKNPKIVGELKIPGFSEYLHPYSDGLLFGLGSDADENTGRVGNLKISMFDNSDPTNVKETDKLIIDDLYYSGASDNHKAILVDARKQLIAFPADQYYVIYRYDVENGFVQEAKIALENAGADGYYYGSAGLRGIFIGDVFYVITPNSINSYDMNVNFAKLDSVPLGEDAVAVDRGSYYYPGEEIVPLNDDVMIDYIE
jgi:uncharacterized secreted protein with C-terminal beta-propeller domain